MPFPSRTDRQTILETAMEQVSARGLEDVAVRSVAAALGLAPNALYRYFANLAALRDALAEESRLRLYAVLVEAARRKQPEKAVRAVAKAYLLFARQQPRIFELTLMPPCEGADVEGAHVQLWNFVLELVGCIYGARKAPEAAVVLWAFLQGMTTLEAAHVFGDRKPAKSFEFGLRMWFKAAAAAR